MHRVALELKDGAVEREFLLHDVDGCTPQILAVMERRGYIERKRYPDSKLLSGMRLREEYISLTQEGRRAFGLEL